MAVGFKVGYYWFQVGTSDFLHSFPSSDVIWDAEDLSLTPPWGNNISSDITDLSNYFVTSDGRDLISVLSEAMNEAKEMQCDIEIDNL